MMAEPRRRFRDIVSLIGSIGVYASIMEKQMEKNMEHNMETGLIGICKMILKHLLNSGTGPMILRAQAIEEGVEAHFPEDRRVLCSRAHTWA